MSLRTDAEQHHLLVEELVVVFRQLGYRILGADGVEGLPPPKKLHNDGYGDQRDKMPDVYAFDEKEQRYVIGEAKTGRGDLETEHALTQYNVFLDQFDRSTGRQARLYVILPESRIPEFNSLITHYIHREYWQSIVVVRSKRWQE